MTIHIRQLNVRIPVELADKLESVAQEEQVDRTSLVRKFLEEGLQRYRLEQALHLYEQGRISKERAAELAGVSLYDILDELRKRGAADHYDLDELRQDLTLLREYTT